MIFWRNSLVSSWASSLVGRISWWKKRESRRKGIELKPDLYQIFHFCVVICFVDVCFHIKQEHHHHHSLTSQTEGSHSHSNPSLFLTLQVSAELRCVQVVDDVRESVWDFIEIIFMYIFFPAQKNGNLLLPNKRQTVDSGGVDKCFVAAAVQWVKSRRNQFSSPTLILDVPFVVNSLLLRRVLHLISFSTLSCQEAVENVEPSLLASHKYESRRSVCVTYLQIKK